MLLDLSKINIRTAGSSRISGWFVYLCLQKNLRWNGNPRKDGGSWGVWGGLSEVGHLCAESSAKCDSVFHVLMGVFCLSLWCRHRCLLFVLFTSSLCHQWLSGVGGVQTQNHPLWVCVLKNCQLFTTDRPLMNKWLEIQILPPRLLHVTSFKDHTTEFPLKFRRRDTAEGTSHAPL